MAFSSWPGQPLELDVSDMFPRLLGVGEGIQAAFEAVSGGRVQSDDILAMFLRGVSPF